MFLLNQDLKDHSSGWYNVQEHLANFWSSLNVCLLSSSNPPTNWNEKLVFSRISWL